MFLKYYFLSLAYLCINLRYIHEIQAASDMPPTFSQSCEFEKFNQRIQEHEEILLRNLLTQLNNLKQAYITDNTPEICESIAEKIIMLIQSFDLVTENHILDNPIMQTTASMPTSFVPASPAFPTSPSSEKSPLASLTSEKNYYLIHLIIDHYNFVLSELFNLFDTTINTNTNTNTNTNSIQCAISHYEKILTVLLSKLTYSLFIPHPA